MQVSLLLLGFFLTIVPCVRCFLIWRHQRSTQQTQLKLLHMIRGMNNIEFNAISSGKTKTIKDLLSTSGSNIPTISIPSSKTTNNLDAVSFNQRKKKSLREKMEKEKLSLRVRPFSRIVNVDQIPLYKSVACKVKAKEEERQYVADELKLVGIESLTANVSLSWVDGRRSGVNVVGNVRMKLTGPLSILESDQDNIASSESEPMEELKLSLSNDITYSIDDNPESTQYPPPLSLLSDNELFTLETSFESCLFHNDQDEVNHRRMKRKNVSNIAGEKILNFNYLEDFDDEIPTSGDIDIGAIIVQYISLDHF